MKLLNPMDEDDASGLGARIVAKVNELIRWISKNSKADVAWKTEAEVRLTQLEKEVASLKVQNRGLKIAKGKAAASKSKAIEAQKVLEAKISEARRLLH